MFVTIFLDRCEVSDEETLDLLLDFKDAFDKQPKVGVRKDWILSLE